MVCKIFICSEFPDIPEKVGGRIGRTTLKPMTFCFLANAKNHGTTRLSNSGKISSENFEVPTYLIPESCRNRNKNSQYFCSAQYGEAL